MATFTDIYAGIQKDHMRGVLHRLSLTVLLTLKRCLHLLLTRLD